VERPWATPKFDRYVEDSCRILKGRLEYPEDNHLVRLIRMHQVMDNVRVMLYDDILGSDPQSATFAAASVVVSAFEREIQQMGLDFAIVDESPSGTFPEYLLSPDPTLNIWKLNRRRKTVNTVVRALSRHTLELLLYKFVLDERALKYSQSPDPGSHLIKRLQYVDCCLRSISAFITAFVAIPDVLILSPPYPVWAFLGHAVMIFRQIVVLMAAHVEFRPSMATLRGPSQGFEALAQKVECAVEVDARRGDGSNRPAVFRKVSRILLETASSVSTVLGDSGVAAQAGANGNPVHASASLEAGLPTEMDVSFYGDIDAFLNMFVENSVDN
jgi:hypothetical protein